MKGINMSSPRKKKIAKYMIEDLLNIAKKQVIKLHPELDAEAIADSIVQEYAEKQKEFLLSHFPQDDMKILLKYKRAYNQETIVLRTNKKNYLGKLGILLPQNYYWDINKEFDEIEVNYESEIEFKISQIEKELTEKLKPYKNLLNSVRYIEDVTKLWQNDEVAEYVRKKSDCVVCTALTTLTENDVQMIMMNEKLLKEKNDASSVN